MNNRRRRILKELNLLPAWYFRSDTLDINQSSLPESPKNEDITSSFTLKENSAQPKEIDQLKLDRKSVV